MSVGLDYVCNRLIDKPLMRAAYPYTNTPITINGVEWPKPQDNPIQIVPKKLLTSFAIVETAITWSPSSECLRPIKKPTIIAEIIPENLIASCSINRNKNHFLSNFNFKLVITLFIVLEELII